MPASAAKIKNRDRLKKRSDFLHVQSAGRKWVSKGVILQTCPHADPASLRYGLTVSKKVSTSAVVRNRIRRRLREAAKTILPVHALPGADYVLIGRPETGVRPYKDLQNDLIWCLKKLGQNRDGQGE